MIKKKLGVLIAGVVVVGSLAGITINLNNETKAMIQQIETLQKEVEDLNNKGKELTEEKEGLTEEKEKLNKENEDLQKNIEELKKKYSELDALYKKEIEPVSFSSNNLKTPSNATIAKLEGVLRGTGLEGLSKHYLDAEEKYGVNAIFLVALTAEESGWGNSHRARTQNNLSGYAVYSASATGSSFCSKGESILATAELLSEDYLNVDGEYYNGLSAYAVNIRYCPNDGGNWSSNIVQIAHEIVDRINSQ